MGAPLRRAWRCVRAGPRCALSCSAVHGCLLRSAGTRRLRPRAASAQQRRTRQEPCVLTLRARLFTRLLQLYFMEEQFRRKAVSLGAEPNALENMLAEARTACAQNTQNCV